MERIVVVGEPIKISGHFSNGSHRTPRRSHRLAARTWQHGGRSTAAEVDRRVNNLLAQLAKGAVPESRSSTLRRSTRPTASIAVQSIASRNSQLSAGRLSRPHSARVGHNRWRGGVNVATLMASQSDAERRRDEQAALEALQQGDLSPRRPQSARARQITVEDLQLDLTSPGRPQRPFSAGSRGSPGRPQRPLSAGSVGVRKVASEATRPDPPTGQESVCGSVGRPQRPQSARVGKVSSEASCGSVGRPQRPQSARVGKVTAEVARPNPSTEWESNCGSAGLMQRFQSASSRETSIDASKQDTLVQSTIASLPNKQVGADRRTRPQSARVARVTPEANQMTFSRGCESSCGSAVRPQRPQSARVGKVTDEATQFDAPMADRNRGNIGRPQRPQSARVGRTIDETPTVDILTLYSSRGRQQQPQSSQGGKSIDEATEVDMSTVYQSSRGSSCRPSRPQSARRARSFDATTQPARRATSFDGAAQLGSSAMLEIKRSVASRPQSARAGKVTNETYDNELSKWLETDPDIARQRKCAQAARVGSVSRDASNDSIWSESSFGTAKGRNKRRVQADEIQQSLHEALAGFGHAAAGLDKGPPELSQGYRGRPSGNSRVDDFLAAIMDARLANEHVRAPSITSVDHSVAFATTVSEASPERTQWQRSSSSASQTGSAVPATTLPGRARGAASIGTDIQSAPSWNPADYQLPRKWLGSRLGSTQGDAPSACFQGTIDSASSLGQSDLCTVTTAYRNNLAQDRDGAESDGSALTAGADPNPPALWQIQFGPDRDRYGRHKKPGPFGNFVFNTGSWANRQGTGEMVPYRQYGPVGPLWVIDGGNGGK